MEYLHILGEGKTKSARANSKGHLFEYLMRDLLRELKVEIKHLNRSKHGTEIDIEGLHFVSNAPIIAECKAKEDPLSSEDVQKFAFKILHARNNNSRASGFLFTVSSLNSKATELWEELKESYGDSLTLYEEKQLIDLLIEQLQLCTPNTIRHEATSQYHRQCGDTQLLCVKGERKDIQLFWAQLLMSSDGTEPNLVVFYTESGQLVTAEKTVNRLLGLKPEFSTSSITCLNLKPLKPSPVGLVDEVSPARTVVRVRMSKDWFDYRFPAAPEFFVGRTSQRQELSHFIESVQGNRTSVRGIFFSGKSGIGKSSLALKTQQELRGQNIILLPIDSRLCDDISFLYDSINELLFELRQVPRLHSSLQEIHVRGLDSLIETLTDINKILEREDFYTILFFDQFEKVFDLPEVTKAIRNLFLRATERQLRILFGFAWKSDLWSQAEGFPHSERDDIIRESFAVQPLMQFGQQETTEILNKLEILWGDKLSELLRRQLATFSRGLPWLLKKVCAHVLEQKNKGVTQDELVETNLKLQDLFEADLAGLDDEERTLLRAIAPLLPTTLRRLSEHFEIANIDRPLHRFIDKRILVKITEDVGASYANVKYDAYSDIFREFLITGNVPLEDAYYFFTYPKGALKFFNKVKDRGSLSIDQEIAETGKLMASIYNLSRDLRQLGLIDVNNKVFTILPEAADLDDEELLPYLQGRLKQNRLVSLTLSEINTAGYISLKQVAELLKELFPSVKATDKTWMTYSRTTAAWLHESRLAYYNSRDARLYEVDDEEAFEKVVSRGGLRERGFRLPVRFRNAILDCILILEQNGHGCGSMEQLAKWLQKKPPSVEMALSDNLNLGFVYYDAEVEQYCLTETAKEFVAGDDAQRRQIFQAQCQNVPVYNQFIEAIGREGKAGMSHQAAVHSILQEHDLDLADATIEKLGAILANWAEYAGDIVRTGRHCTLKKYAPRQIAFDFR